MKKVVSMAVCAVVLLVAGMAMAGECKGKKGDFFAKADTDKDGKLTLAEFTAACKDTATAEAKFQAADTDKDGFLSPAELKAAHPKKGAKMDCAKPAEAPAVK
jgi:hypothetical protein